MTYQTLLRRVEPLKLAYLHAIKSPDKNIDVATLAKECFRGPLIINGGFTKESGQLVVQSKKAEAVSFGQYFIANPNLPERLRHDIPLQELNSQYLYSGDEKGYIDYK
jgi:N-ethylmaleimide reductase